VKAANAVSASTPTCTSDDTDLASVTVLPLSPSGPFDVSLERLELLAPVGLELVEPRLERDDRLRAQPEHPRPGIVRQPLVGDDPDLQQHAQMAAHRRRRHPRRIGELARASRPRAEKAHDGAPGGISEGNEERCDLLVEIHGHG
jgi:hypothetical protein